MDNTQAYLKAAGYAPAGPVSDPPIDRDTASAYLRAAGYQIETPATPGPQRDLRDGAVSPKGALPLDDLPMDRSAWQVVKDVAGDVVPALGKWAIGTGEAAYGLANVATNMNRIGVSPVGMMNAPGMAVLRLTNKLTGSDMPVAVPTLDEMSRGITKAADYVVTKVGNAITGKNIEQSDNASTLSQNFSQLNKSIDSLKSQGLQHAEHARSAKVKEQDTWLGKAGTAAAETVKNPELLVNSLVEMAPDLLMWQKLAARKLAAEANQVGKLVENKVFAEEQAKLAVSGISAEEARKLAGQAALQEAARARDAYAASKLAEKRSANYIAAGMGVKGAGTGAVDGANVVYDASQPVMDHNPVYQELIAAGFSDRQARDRMAQGAALKSGLIGGVINYAGGQSGLSQQIAKLALGKSAKNSAGQAAAAIVTDTAIGTGTGIAGQMGNNAVQQTYGNTEAGLMDDTALAAGAGAANMGVLGLVMHGRALTSPLKPASVAEAKLTASDVSGEPPDAGATAAPSPAMLAKRAEPMEKIGRSLAMETSPVLNEVAPRTAVVKDIPQALVVEENANNKSPNQVPTGTAADETVVRKQVGGTGATAGSVNELASARSAAAETVDNSSTKNAATSKQDSDATRMPVADPDPGGRDKNLSNKNPEQGQDKKPGPVSFSQLEKYIDDEMPRNGLEKVSPESALSWLGAEAARGDAFSASELKESGVMEWLAIQEGPLTVDQISAFVERNRAPASTHDKYSFGGAPDGVIPKDPNFDTTAPFKTLTEANMFKLKHGIDAGVKLAGKDTKDGFVFYPPETKHSKKEKAAAKELIASVNARRAKDGQSLVQATPIFSHNNLELRLAQFIGKIFGAEVFVVKENGQFEGVTIGEKIFLSEKMKSPVTAIIGHEVSHFLERVNPAAHQKLKDFTWKYLQDGYIEVRRNWDNAQLKKNAKEMSPAGAHNEVIADLTGAMWLDPLFWREMIKRDQNMFRQVAYVFMEVSSKVAHAVKGKNFDIRRIVTDIETTRKILADVWAEHLQESDLKRVRDRGEPSPAKNYDVEQGQNSRSEADAIHFSRRADAENYRREQGLDHDVVEDGQGRYILTPKTEAGYIEPIRESSSHPRDTDAPFPEESRVSDSQATPELKGDGPAAERSADPDPPDSVGTTEKGQNDSAPFSLFADSIQEHLPVDENGLISPDRASSWLMDRANGPAPLDAKTLDQSGVLLWLDQQKNPVSRDAIAEYVRNSESRIREREQIFAANAQAGAEGSGGQPEISSVSTEKNGRNPEATADAAGKNRQAHRIEKRTAGKNVAFYMLDALGNTLSVSGSLREYFTKAKRSSKEKRAQRKVGKAGGKKDDDGGHLAAFQFMLDQGLINLFAQNHDFNQSAFHVMENDFVRYMDLGFQVDYTHTLGNFDSLGRPGSVTVEFIVTDSKGTVIDGHRQEFGNDSKQVYHRRVWKK